MSTNAPSRVDPATEVSAILKARKASLVRHNKHEVWKFPTGEVFVRACTPSDKRGSENNLRDLKALLGIQSQFRGIPGERRDRKPRPGAARAVKITASASGSLQDKLRASGLWEDALNAKMAVLKLELRNTRRAATRRRLALRQIETHCVSCWACRLRRWWRRIWNA